MAFHSLYPFIYQNFFIFKGYFAGKNNFKNFKELYFCQKDFQTINNLKFLHIHKNLSTGFEDLINFLDFYL